MALGTAAPDPAAPGTAVAGACVPGTADPGTADPGTALLDPSDEAFARDPFPYYAALRSQGPAARIPLANGTYAWLITGYEQTRAVLADPRFSNVPPQAAGRPKPDSPAQRARACLARHMLNSDAPDHTRLRRLTAAAFTPRRVDALRPRIEELTAGLVRDLVARLERDGSADLVDAFAFPLPVLVIGEVLGVPEAHRDDLRKWTYRVGSPADALPQGEVDTAWTQLHAYFTALIAEKRCTPGDDLFSALVHDSTEGGLDDGELLAMAFLLLFAGYETTMNLLASASLLLLSHPDELAAAQRDPARWTAVVEESLRHASPLEGTTWRRTTDPVDLGGGARIPAGASVLAVLAAANRDPARFPDPDAFRPGRYAVATTNRTQSCPAAYAPPHRNRDTRNAPATTAGPDAGSTATDRPHAGSGVTDGTGADSSVTDRTDASSDGTAHPHADTAAADTSGASSASDASVGAPGPAADPYGTRAAPHAAFGHGPHFCVGSRLARLEAAVALPLLFDALPGLRLAVDPAELPYRPGLLVRGPRQLPVTQA
ncbi:cytochrome P450 [Streptomyces sp. NPDC004647]|uniref:cytochrome P450 n=1 Tax=Streptomyces sp. NPDC004647 TaxID=3154671 RepID=UPI0033A726D9